MTRSVRAVVLSLAAIALVGVGNISASTERQPASGLEYVIAEAGDNYFRVAADQSLTCTGTELWAANGRAPLDPGTIVLIPPSCLADAPPDTTTTTTAPPVTTTPDMPGTETPESQFDLTFASNEFLTEPGGSSGTRGDTGEVRIVCGLTAEGQFDPIVNPGGVSHHLHQFFGNADIRPDSTYESLREGTSGSTCAGGAVNKSSYWIPALLDESGGVVTPDLFFVYYKTGYWGQDGRDIVDIPEGLKMVSVPLEGDSTSSAWNCAEGPFRNRLPGQCGGTTGMTVMFQQCWNGTDLDSDDHRSHMAHPNFSGQCPTSHPVLLPQVTVNARWEGNGNMDGWRLASDMRGDIPGSSLHADFFEAWDPASRAGFVERCLNGRRDCGFLELGDGRTLTRFD